ncbi:UNVERIFIED_CONTAM: Transcription factor [Sesamum radiatum]|uniref:Transcription factor n=1 Tax=Sesamum radiatum TaxID=300843 RepID=A0AAW2S015_SESRA
MGLDPITHKPRNHALDCNQPKGIANLNHMAQWESARLEAEARIVGKSKMVSDVYHSTATPPPLVAPPPPSRPPCLDVLKVWQGAWETPRNGVTTVNSNGFFTINAALTSMTSILKSKDGVVHEHSFASDIMNYVKSPGASAIGRITSDNDHQDGDQVKGKMENSLEIHGMIADWLRYPSFLEGFTDLPPGPADNAVSEDNKISYWNSILTTVDSQMDSPVF